MNWFADAIILKHLGPNSLAAGGLISSLIYIGIGAARVAVIGGVGNTVAGIRGQINGNNDLIKFI